LDVVNHRVGLVLDIAQYKRRHDLPLRDAHREEELLEAIIVRNDGPLPDNTVRHLFREVLDAGLELTGAKTGPGLRVGITGGPAVQVNVRGHCIGGATPQYVAGPCAVESEEQVDQVAGRLAELGVGFLRGGAFKPRTSPYAFQGLGLDGLKLLTQAARRHGLASVTEATGTDNIDQVAEHADMIQVGARNMYNYELLKAVGRTGLPVLLKRSFSASVDEWLHAAEYVALSGSERIVLCERGIRTFVTDTRATLDLAAIPLVRQRSRLPVIVDVSHAAGRRDLIGPLASAAFAIGSDGVMIEIHPDPDTARCDARQQISLDGFGALQRSIAADLHALASRLAPTHTLEREHASQRRL